MAAVGLPPADAAKVAELMVEADLVGADAHGVFRLPQYVRRIKAGGVNPKANITVEKTGAATAMVDGDNGMGHLVMSRAAETAIELAKETGVAWVGAKRSNHAGAAGVYAAMPLPHDMIGIYAVVANANHMPVWGGVGKSARHQSGRVRGAGRRGAAGGARHRHHGGLLRHGQGQQAAGQADARRLDDRQAGRQPLTDSAKSAEGLLLPIGGHKGSGLALVLGPARRHAQRRGVRPRRGRLQLRRHRRLRHRAFHHRARRRALPADRGVQGRGRPPSARSEVVAAAARRRCDPACPASSG